MEARGIKIWWDDRPDLPNWMKYTREATKAEFDEKITGIGHGFDECLNFAFGHPDNSPEVKLYLPPNYKPKAAKPLLLFATYKGQSEMGGCWVGAAAAASILPRFQERERLRKKRKEPLYFRAQADPALVTPFIVPVKIDLKRHLGGKQWFRGPVSVYDPGRVLKDAASKAATRLQSTNSAAERKALLRQLCVCERILLHLGESAQQQQDGASDKQGGSDGRSGGWHPDLGLGELAEKLVFADQEKVLRKLSGKYPGCPKKPIHVALDRPFADHDIESAATNGDQYAKLLIEVKGTKSKDWGTVMISEAQMALARQCQHAPRHTFAIVEFAEGAKKYKIHYKTLLELEGEFSFVPLKYRLSRR